MRIIRNNIIPFKGFDAINIFGLFFVRNNANITPHLINHEKIHSAQMRELGYLFFYPIYLAEWFIRLFKKGNAYRQISFEREAYNHQYDMQYLKKRRHYAMWRRKDY